MKRISLLASFMLLISLKVQATLTPAEILLNAYSSQCPSTVTNAVRGSIINVQKMMAVMRDIRKNSRCFQGNEFQGIMGNFHSTYSDYELYRNLKGDKYSLEQKIAKYTMAIATPGFTDAEKEYMNTVIFESQSEITSLEAEISRFEYLSKDFGLGSLNFINSFDGFLNTWAESPLCFEKKTSLLSSLIGNGLMAASSFANPGTAMSLATAGVLSKSIGRFIVNFKHNGRLEDLSDALMPTALRCVSEALSNQYCTAESVKDVVKTYQDDFGRARHRFEGIDLLSIHSKKLKSWLEEVHAGTPISDEGEMQRRSKPFKQWVLLTEIKQHVETFDNLRRLEMNQGMVGDELRDYIAGGIIGIANILDKPTLSPDTDSTSAGCWGSDCKGGIENPIYAKRDKKLTSFKIFDSTLTRVPSCPDPNGELKECDSVTTYLRDVVKTADIDQWNQAIVNALKIVSITLDEVNEKWNKVKNSDPFQVLTKARRDYKGETNPYRALKLVSNNANRIKDYLMEYACKKEVDECDNGIPSVFNSHYDKIRDVEQTLAYNETILFLLKESFVHRDLDEASWPALCRKPSKSTLLDPPDIDTEIDEKALRVTNCISKVLKLNEKGTSFYFSKVRSMVSYEIEAILNDDGFDDNMEEILYSTKADLVDSLILTYGGNEDMTLDELNTGLETAQDTVKATMDVFMDTFRNHAKETLEKANIKDKVKTDLCFRLLPYAGTKRDRRKFLSKIYDSCKGRKMQEFTGGPLLKWDDYVKHERIRGRYNYVGVKSESDNYCALNRYRLRNRIYRDKARYESQKADLIQSTPMM